MDKPPEINKFTVKEGNKEMLVVIPKTGDKSYDDYLESSEREKTADQLRKRPDKPAPRASREEVSGALREYNEFKYRQRSEHPKKYF